jgi:MYXO-CTERM domain-containing protein
MFLILGAVAAHAGTVDVYDADGLWDAIDHAVPGDDIVAHAGVYETQLPTGSWLRGVEIHGSAKAPITVRAADGDVVVIEGDPAQSQNILNLSGEYFTLSGFELRFGSKGIRMFGSAFATLANLKVHDVGDVGISANSDGDTYESLTFVDNEVYNTGDSGGTGECFYLGCQSDACQMWDSLVEGNWCHDTQMGSQGDGIEIKSGSYDNVVRGNVIHDVNYPGITLYGTRGRGINVVEGNVVWNGLTQGIQLVGEAVVRNNIVMATASYALYSKSSDGQMPEDLTIEHNTIVNGAGICLRVNDWTTAKGITVANNAFSCVGGTAIEVSGSPGTSAWFANAVSGSTDAPGGTFAVASDAFEDGAGSDYYPAKGSLLVDAADSAYAVGDDFNCLERGAGPFDVGAYERDGATNPGWTIAPGFKTCATPGDDTGGSDGTGDDSGADDSGADDSGADDSGTDSGSVSDSGTDSGSKSGCGCASSRSPKASLVAIALALASLHRRRVPKP